MYYKVQIVESLCVREREKEERARSTAKEVHMVCVCARVCTSSHLTRLSVALVRANTSR